MPLLLLTKSSFQSVAWFLSVYPCCVTELLFCVREDDISDLVLRSFISAPKSKCNSCCFQLQLKLIIFPRMRIGIKWISVVKSQVKPCLILCWTGLQPTIMPTTRRTCSGTGSLMYRNSTTTWSGGLRNSLGL